MYTNIWIQKSYGEEVRIVKGKLFPWQRPKNKENPLYSYKKYVCCAACKNTLYASALKGKKEYFPAHHCRRKIAGNSHDYRIKLRDFDKTIKEFVSEI